MGYNNPAPTTKNAPLPLAVVRALVVSVMVAVGSTLIQLMLACLHSPSFNRLSYCRMLHPCAAMLIRALHCTNVLRIPCIPLPAATVPRHSSQQISLIPLLPLAALMPALVLMTLLPFRPVLMMTACLHILISLCPRILSMRGFPLPSAQDICTCLAMQHLCPMLKFQPQAFSQLHQLLAAARLSAYVGT